MNVIDHLNQEFIDTTMADVKKTQRNAFSLGVFVGIAITLITIAGAILVGSMIYV